VPLPPEQNAFLAHQVYDPLAANSEVESDTRRYKVLYVSPPSSTDYKGAVFQDMETKQLIVANAGTDFSNIHDVLADVSMGMMGASTQWPEAAATMRKALELANKQNIPLSQISATGHSLGGAHAQLQAVMFGVHAETFNSFGAQFLASSAPMDPQAIQAAKGRVVNHRMYHDPVSSLAEHIGSSVEYMDRADYQRHKHGGVSMASGEAAAVAEAHRMRNFWDGDRNQPAEIFAHNYLNDLSRSPLQNLPPGIPLDTGLDRFPWGSLQVPSDPRHPDHPMLEQIRTGVRNIDEGIGKPYDDMSERISRCLLAACKDSRDNYPHVRDYSLSGNALNHVDHVVMGGNGNVFAVEGRLDDPAHKRAFVSTQEAIRIPVEQSDQRLQAAHQAIAREQAMAQQQELSRSQNSPERSGPVHTM